MPKGIYPRKKKKPVLLYVYREPPYNGEAQVYDSEDELFKALEDEDFTLDNEESGEEINVYQFVGSKTVRRSERPPWELV